MPLISGTMLTYTEKVLSDFEGFFFFYKKKVPKIKENVQKRVKTMKKVPYGCLCVS